MIPVKISERVKAFMKRKKSTFPNTISEKQWIADFALESKKNNIRYDAADIIRLMYDEGLTPKQAVEKLLN